MVCQVPSKTGGVQVAALEKWREFFETRSEHASCYRSNFVYQYITCTHSNFNLILCSQETEIALTISLKKIQTMMTRLPVFQENVILPLKPRIVRKNKDILLRNLIPFTAEFILNL